jgi:hypothetical protein
VPCRGKVVPRKFLDTHETRAIRAVLFASVKIYKYECNSIYDLKKTAQIVPLGQLLTLLTIHATSF